MPFRSRWLTRANGLTLLRLAAAPALVFAVSEGAAFAAAALLWAAVATDVADGWVARRFGESSPLGKLVDHAVDATFVTAGTAALAAEGQLPVVLAPLIAVAFIQYAVDSRLAAGRELRASSLGRWNGLGYYAIVALPITRDALGLGWPGVALVQAVGWLLVATTIVSIAARLRLVLRSRPLAP